jgi:hypothetical protein
VGKRGKVGILRDRQLMFKACTIRLNIELMKRLEVKLIGEWMKGRFGEGPANKPK